MDFSIIRNEVSMVAVRSRGPGGQNVNKVSSAAQLFWNFQTSNGLTHAEKYLVASKLRNLINSEDQIYLRADEFRDLERNRERALEKLEMFLTKALHKPKARKATKPTYSSKVKKRETKVKRSEVKQGRRRVNWD